MLFFDHDKINFKVEKFPLVNQWTEDLGYHMEEAVPSSVGVGIRRKDTKEPLGIVSDDYFPVQYAEIVDGVEQALVKSGLDTADAEFTTNTYANGAQLELRAKFPAHETEVVGDRGYIIPEFVFRTSHNRTWANNGMIGYWRSVCFNTLVNGSKLAYVYGRHTKHFNVDLFANKVRTAGEYISGEGLEQMRNWFDTRITRDQAIDLFTNTLAKRTDNITGKKVANKVMLSKLMSTFDKENDHLHKRSSDSKDYSWQSGTLWTAYQAGTDWSSHSHGCKGKFHNVRVSREDKVKKMITSPYWKELESVA